MVVGHSPASRPKRATSSAATDRAITENGNIAVAAGALKKTERELQDKLAAAPAKEKPDLQKQL